MGKLRICVCTYNKGRFCFKSLSNKGKEAVNIYINTMFSIRYKCLQIIIRQGFEDKAYVNSVLRIMSVYTLQKERKNAP